MTIITRDHAEKLLENTTEGPWGNQIYGPDEPADITAPIGPLGLPAPIGVSETHDADLVAAAPDLAETVIAQADEIDQLKEQLSGMSEEWGIAWEGKWNAKTDLYVPIVKWRTDGESREGVEQIVNETARENSNIRRNIHLVRRLVGPVEVVDE